MVHDVSKFLQGVAGPSSAKMAGTKDIQSSCQPSHLHLSHEAGCVVLDAVPHAHVREDAVDQGDGGKCGRDWAANMRHDHDKGHLAQVRGLARHVGCDEEVHAGAVCGECMRSLLSHGDRIWAESILSQGADSPARYVSLGWKDTSSSCSTSGWRPPIMARGPSSTTYTDGRCRSVGLRLPSLLGCSRL